MIALVLLSLSCSLRGSPDTHRITALDVARWRLLGIGDVSQEAEGSILRLREGRDSKGVVLLSPRVFPSDCVLRFQVRPERHEGVNVVFFSVSERPGAESEFPEGYDGNLRLWQGNDAPVQSYMIAFHTGYHQPNAFVRRNPGIVELAAAPDVVTRETWHQIEIGRAERRIWLKVDGEPVLDAVDTGASPLPGGRIGLRLRGPGDGTFSSLYRDFEVVEGMR
jgi:hypothetical protein